MRGSSSKPRQKFQVHNYEQRKPFKKKPKQEKVSGLGVAVHDNDVNKALRIFKKKAAVLSVHLYKIELRHQRREVKKLKKMFLSQLFQIQLKNLMKTTQFIRA